MARVRRYLFDRDFGPPGEEALFAEAQAAALAAAEEAEIEIVEVEPEPTFALADLEAARREGFQQGCEQGFRDAQKTNEKMLLETAGKALAQVAEMFRIQESANAARAREAVEVAVTVVRKLFPSYCAQHGCGEIEGLVGGLLAHLESEPKVTVLVHASALELLAPLLAERAAPLGLGDRLVVMAADGVAPGDCVVKWNNGGAERVTAETWQEIDRILARNAEASETAATVEVPAVAQALSA